MPKSYKGLFPFRIGTTSFIYPDSYVKNVEMLAPYLDEIELILFESTSKSLPSKNEIKELLSLANEYDLFYNIHLPLDIYLGAPDLSIRYFAIETIKLIIDLTAPLSPTTYTLHLPYEESDFENERIKKWKERTYRAMKELITGGTNSEIISIENLNYPFEWVEDILIDFNLSVCMDLGHLIFYGFDMENVFDRYKHRTSIVHLHGANEHQDHQALDFLSNSDLTSILKMLKKYRGALSIEVFSFEHLNASLNHLDNIWKANDV